MKPDNLIKNATLSMLNELTASQSALLMLRIMNTSDLTFLHTLFERSTNYDIVDQMCGLINTDDGNGLSSEQIKEAADLASAIVGGE